MSQVPGLISCDVIFGKKTYFITDHEHNRQTDRHDNTALCTIVHRALKTKAKPKSNSHLYELLMCARIIVHVHSTTRNSSDNFPSYPPDNHHSSDGVYWMGGDLRLRCKSQIPLRYLVADKSEAGRRPAASWNLAYHLARQQRASTS